jgi:lysozyme
LRRSTVALALIPLAWAAALACGRGDDAKPVVPPVPAAAEVAAERVRAAARAAADTLPPRGIDVSHWQGRVNWRAVEEAGIGFAFLKATEGTSFVDPTFRGHWAALGETRILRGAYHRFRASRDAAAQAEHFLTVVSLREGDLPPALDVEATDGVSSERVIRGARTWLQIVERRTGVRPIVYTRPNFRRTHLGTALDDYPLWIGEYDVDAPSADGWAFWQHSQQGRVPGIATMVDLNRFSGTHAELRQLAASRASGTDAAKR